MRILIIEDDKDTACTLKDELKDKYAVDLAYTGEEGDYLAQTCNYDVIILDLVLPDRNGLKICKDLRKTGIKTPILILTGKDKVENKVEALDAGADDYLVKPFSFAELEARLRALLRRKDENFKSVCISVGDLTIDTAKRTVERQKKQIYLRRKEFEILEYLARNKGKVITREMITDHLWDCAYEVLSNSVDVHIKHLRDKLDKPFNKKIIKTVYGIGYKLDL